MTERCVICKCASTILHRHHVIPRCYGGRDGAQVDMCGDCHTTLHAYALAILAFQRNGKPIQNFWKTAEDEDRARPLVAQIVKAAQNYEGPKEYKMMLTLDAETYNMLKFMKNNLAISSLEKTLASCIKLVYNMHHGEKRSTNRNGW